MESRENRAPNTGHRALVIIEGPNNGNNHRMGG